MLGSTTGRLHHKVFWYCPKAEEEWNWNRKERVKAGFGARTLVYVQDHTFNVCGRLSNFVTFVRVNKDGTLGKKTYGCYDYGQFKAAKGSLDIRVRYKRG